MRVARRPGAMVSRPQGLSLHLPRIYPRRLGLALIFLMAGQSLYFLPGMAAPSEVWNVLCFLFLCFFYLGWKAKAGERFIGFEIFVFIMMGVTPIWAGIMAQHVFGQPLIYGILAQRTAILSVSALALLMFYRIGWINTADVKEALLFLAWVTLFIYSIWEASKHFSVTTATGQSKMRINTTFVVLGFLYYGLIGFRRKSWFHYALALPFLLFIISLQERMLLLASVTAYGFFVLIRGSLPRLVVFVPRAIVGLLMLVGVLYLIDSQGVTNFAERMVAAATVVTTGQTTTDISANARVYETTIAIPYIENSPIFGNGDLSNRWYGGYNGIFQANFYPSDIGVIGVVYIFGFMGLALFACQLWWVRKFVRRASFGRATPPIIDAVFAYLLSYVIESTSTGVFALKWSLGATLIMFLYCAGREAHRKGTLATERLSFRSDDLRGIQRSE